MTLRKARYAYMRTGKAKCWRCIFAKWKKRPKQKNKELWCDARGCWLSERWNHDICFRYDPKALEEKRYPYKEVI